MEKNMHFKRYLFFTLILFLIVFSMSFVSANENSTNDQQVSELMTLSISDDINYDDNVKFDSVNASLKATLDQVYDAQNTDEIESEVCLTNEAQLLRASNDEPVLGAAVENMDSGTAQEVVNKILEMSNNGGGTLYLNGGTYTGSGTLQAARYSHPEISNVRVIGGSQSDPTQMAIFTDGGPVLKFRGTPRDWGTKFYSDSGYIVRNLTFQYLKANNKFIEFDGGSLIDTVIDHCESRYQFVTLNGCYEGGEQIHVYGCNFTNSRQTYPGDNGIKDGTGQFGAVFGIDMRNCNFINTSSAQHGGALCVADESEWGSSGVTSTIVDTNFINITSRWFSERISVRKC